MNINFKKIVLICIIMGTIITGATISYGQSTINIVNGITYVNDINFVNKNYGLPTNYDPGENPLARSAFEEMKKYAKQYGIYLTAFSTYRSYSYQNSLYWSYVARDGQAEADTYSARPGYSEHQTGLAFDIGGRNISLWGNDDFAYTDEGGWLADNSYKYGFALRYPKGKEHITGYKYEPWHFRYLGVYVAMQLYESGLTLEEYLGLYKNGWINEDNKWYFYEGNEKSIGWRYLGESWYYFDNEGIMSTGWNYLGVKWYYFNESGSMMKSQWFKDTSGAWYFLKSDGSMACNEELEIGGSKFRFNSSGRMCENEWYKENGMWYFYKSGGYRINNEWILISGNWFRFNENSIMLENKWYWDGTNWYWLKDNGYRAYGEVINIGGTNHKFDLNGLWIGPQ